MDKTTRPFNLARGEYGPVYTLGAREAVIAAHAQSLGDYNTWEYERRYASQTKLTLGRHFICGDWTARSG